MNSKQILNSFLFFIVLLLCAGLQPTHAQTLRFEMDIQPELSIEVLQNLNFGTVVAGSGTHRIPLGNANMGVFEIRALATQRALLTLAPPDSLSLERNVTQPAIPIKVDAAFSTRASHASTTPFQNNSLWVTLQPEESNGDEYGWETGYVYITGQIEVGDIPAGSYSGTLVLSVEYQ